MKTYLVLFLWLITTPVCLYAQYDNFLNKPDTVIQTSDFFVSIIDNKALRMKDDVSYLDNIWLGEQGEPMYDLMTSNVYYGGDVIYKLNIAQNKLDSICPVYAADETRVCGPIISQDRLFVGIENISEIDMNRYKSQIKCIDLNNKTQRYLYTSTTKTIVKIAVLPNINKILLDECYIDEGEYVFGSHEYLLCDIETGTTTNFQLVGLNDKPSSMSWYLLSDISNNYFFIQMYGAIADTIYPKRKGVSYTYILDKNFNIVANMPWFWERIRGYNFKEGKLQSVNLKIDNNILQYKIMYESEQLMLDVYNNQPLHQTLFDKLDEHQWHVLKNMVYAKYKYQFDDLYYINLFSCYSFYYNQKLVSDINVVESQFTPTDRQNLQLIQQQLQKYPKHR